MSKYKHSDKDSGGLRSTPNWFSHHLPGILHSLYLAPNWQYTRYSAIGNPL